MRYWITLTLGALMLLGGCAALDEEVARRQPTASIESARLAGVSFDAAEIVADVRIDNPNPVAVTLAGFDYDVQLVGRSLVAGERDEELRIGANDQARIDIPLQFNFADVRDIMRDIGGDDEIGYSLALGLDIEVPVLGTRTIPVETSGTLPVLRLPNVSLERLRIDELAWNGASATLELAVVNPNAFGLDLDRLGYDLAVDGTTWVSGSETVAARVPAKGAGRVDIPIQLNFATIGRGAYRLLTGSGEFDYNLDGSIAGVAGDHRLGSFDLDFSRGGEAGIQR